MLLIFVAMLSEILLIVLLIIIGVLFVALYLSKKRSYCGNNPYIALLLSFLISGVGLAYLGLPLKGLIWYLIQIISVLIALMVSQSVNIQEKYLGLIIMLPFFVQLYVTGIEFKKKHGDITW